MSKKQDNDFGRHSPIEINPFTSSICYHVATVTINSRNPPPPSFF